MSKLELTLFLVVLLACASWLNRLWGRRQSAAGRKALHREVALRIQAWWLMCFLFLAAWWCGRLTTLALFLVVSGLALPG